MLLHKNKVCPKVQRWTNVKRKTFSFDYRLFGISRHINLIEPRIDWKFHMIPFLISIRQWMDHIKELFSGLSVSKIVEKTFTIIQWLSGPDVRFFNMYEFL